jgi:hypothetical protein
VVAKWRHPAGAGLEWWRSPLSAVAVDDGRGQTVTITGAPSLAAWNTIRVDGWFEFRGINDVRPLTPQACEDWVHGTRPLR